MPPIAAPSSELRSCHGKKSLRWKEKSVEVARPATREHFFARTACTAASFSFAVASSEWKTHRRDPVVFVGMKLRSGNLGTSAKSEA